MLNKFFDVWGWAMSDIRKNKPFFQNEKRNRKYSSLGFLLHTFDKPYILTASSSCDLSKEALTQDVF